MDGDRANIVLYCRETRPSTVQILLLVVRGEVHHGRPLRIKGVPGWATQRSCSARIPDLGPSAACRFPAAPPSQPAPAGRRRVMRLRHQDYTEPSIRAVTAVILATEDPGIAVSGIPR